MPPSPVPEPAPAGSLTVPEPTLRVEMDDPSSVHEARRVAGRLATGLGYGVVERERIAIVVSELASNVVKHTRGGSLLLQPALRDGSLEVLALDHGPGMADVRRCLRDGYSTGGGLGAGLGAVRRQSAGTSIFSEPREGTVVHARFAPPGAPRPAPGGATLPDRPAEDLTVLRLPATGETACGDAVAVLTLGGAGTLLLMVDGLGHGPAAAEAAELATAVLPELAAGLAAPGTGTAPGGRSAGRSAPGAAAERATPPAPAAPTGPAAGPSPARLLSALHQRLRHTRGAAAVIAHLDPARSVLRAAGIGNVVLAVQPAQGRPWRLVGRPGTLGRQIPAPTDQELRLNPGDRLIMHTDGLNTRWNLTDRPALLRTPPPVMATVLLRDHTRGRDDATVLVADCPPREAA
ncbi:SpoIIE family protein phosphatase [Allostreptomyces psammosilenae]|uniref:Anti-sigma regulatory factor (Ser/Thr protein kinase) n=1 Tax=Allostreptomyces psammosilenae TaxID=1892865 RepID=A0A852ZYP0_9ACTN|nr:SpoIIE family protein phosphatase [Allostreptomyces psammosilenae]NYI06937.1 anti-sigma regulatory factor (Ser/Thr protein kinase) [Allostreptomyces psammosilenae]